VWTDGPNLWKAESLEMQMRLCFTSVYNEVVFSVLTCLRIVRSLVILSCEILSSNSVEDVMAI
jgi:hypothetical protein